MCAGGLCCLQMACTVAHGNFDSTFHKLVDNILCSRQLRSEGNNGDPIKRAIACENFFNSTLKAPTDEILGMSAGLFFADERPFKMESKNGCTVGSPLLGVNELLISKIMILALTLGNNAG